MSLNELLVGGASDVKERPWSALSVASLSTGFAPGLIDFLNISGISGSGILTADELMTKFAVSNSGTPIALVTDSAANIISAMKSDIGTGFEFTFTSGGKSVTITGGANVGILGGSLVIPNQGVGKFFVMYDASNHILIYPSASSFAQNGIANSSPGLVDFGSESVFSSSGVISAASIVAKLSRCTAVSTITLTTDSAANIISALGFETGIGNNITWTCINDSTTNGVILAAGTGVIFEGSSSEFVVPPASKAQYQVAYTGSTAITFHVLSESGEQLGTTSTITGIVANSTLTYADIAGGILSVNTGGGNITLTLDTATNYLAAQSLVVGPYVGFTVRCKIINLGGNSIVFATASGSSILSSYGGTVPTGTTIELALVCTGLGGSLAYIACF